MVAISVDEGVLKLEIEGLDKLWSFKSRLEIPLAHVRGARVDNEVARRWWKGFRVPGTSIPGIITAGTFYQNGKRIFWDVHDPDSTIIIDLADDRYDQLVVEVGDPAAEVKRIEEIVSGGPAGKGE
jgi:hypothetical protein